MTDAAPIRPSHDEEIVKAVKAVNAATSPPEKIAKVAQGRLATSPSKKALRAIFVTGAKDWGAYILTDVLLPSIRDVISSVIIQGTERALYGESYGGRRPGTPGLYSSGWTQRTNYSSNQGNPIGRASGRYEPQERRPDYGDILLDTRGEAQSVISQMQANCDRYGAVTVGDLYNMVGISTAPVDERWVWNDLRYAGTRRVRNGYILDLPEPRYQER